MANVTDMAIAARAPASIASSPLAAVGPCVEARVAGALVTAFPEGALWIESARALIFSDLHLEKGSAFAKRGQFLPPYDTRATLQRLAALCDALTPDLVISLGDSFHDADGPARMEGEDRALLTHLIARTDWVWIEGNHDHASPAQLGGALMSELKLGDLVLRHEPLAGLARGEIAGHLHPCAKVSGRGRSVRRRCFATDGVRLVMPAFGAYAGGLNVCDAAFAPLFPSGCTALMLGRERVMPAGYDRLIAD